MTLEEILDSGLLELYVLGKLSPDERQEVEKAIQQYPEVKREILEIEQGLYKYDGLFKVEPSSTVLDQLKEEIRSSSTSEDDNLNKGKNLWGLLSIILGLSLLSTIFFFNQKTNTLEQTIDEQQGLIVDCDEEKVQLAEQLRLQESILEYESQKIFITPTEKFPDVEMIIYNNKAAQRNFLQIKNLPPLASNQSFQLWSLRGSEAPIPLDVFESDVNPLLEIQFIEATDAYAITIEPLGGQDAPTLENLIGVFTVAT